MNATETPQALLDRVAAATVPHRDAQEVAERKAKAWRRAIVDAIDAGVRTKDVAAAAGISSSRVHAIVLTEESRP